MQEQLFNSIAVLAAILILSAGLLQGCGGGDVESNEDFVKEMRNRSGEADGTLPPIGEPMGNVAQIRLETHEMDLHIANDQPHFDKLKVYNDGKMPLKITKIDTSCACTQGSISPERATIQPGQSTWIDVMVDPTRIPGFKTRKVLTITSTDPERSFIEVGVTSHVDPEYELDTDDEIDVGDMMKGNTVERTIRFRQIQEAPVHVTNVEPLTVGIRNAKIPGVTAELTEIPEAQWKTPGKREYDIKLTIGPDLPAGKFERNVMLTTDVARFHVQRILVLGTVVAPYQVTPLYPERAVLVPDATGANLSTAFLIIGNSPVTIANVAPEDPALVTEVVPGDSADQAKLTVRLPGAAPAGTLDETIRFQVNVDGHAYDEFVGVRFGTPVAADGH